MKTNEIFLFLISFSHKCLYETLHEGTQPFSLLGPTQYSIFDPFAIEVWKCIHYRRAGSVFYGSVSIAMNMPIGIILKIDPSGLQQKCISGDFPQLLELPLLRMHIDGCFQSVREATVSGIFAKYIGKQI